MKERNQPLNIVIIGLSITSSWGNGHATTYRALCRELHQMGHKVTFLEKNVPWYSGNRDMPAPEFCSTILYSSNEELKQKYHDLVATADLVIVGSYVQQGVDVGWWVIKTARGKTAFYDIDTPVTLKKLAEKDYEYLAPELIPQYDMYLSFTGGPTLDLLERKYRSPRARALYCSVDPHLYFPQEREKLWDLGYLGTYSDDRQPPLEDLMLQAARKYSSGSFVVAGPQYPQSLQWPPNVERIEHLPPQHHCKFYNSQRATLNITREAMKKAGYAPSVRLFEAAACGVPVISDYWNGLDSIFKIDEEILVSYSAEDTVYYLKEFTESELKDIGRKAREKVLKHHTARHRAQELVGYYWEMSGIRTF